MTSIRSFLVAVACALPLSIAACGSDGATTITPEGTHYGYVVSKASVPTNSTDAGPKYGLDLGSKTSAKLDGTADNRLGETLGTLAGLGFDIQGTLDLAVDEGSIILLIDFQTKDFTSSSAAGFGVKIGANPTPAACTDPTDITTCRQHLNGTASFQIAPNSPPDAVVAGTIVNGTFNGGPGDLTLQIAIGGTTPISLDLLHARVQASTISETGIMTAKVGGLVTQEELNTQIGPAIQTEVATIIKRDCTGTPPDCGCTAGTTGSTVITTGIDADHNCVITTEEILSFPLVASLLTPDSCSMDSCTAPDSLSIGVQVQAVKATF